MYQCIRGGETSRSHHTNAQKTSHLYLPKTSLFRPVCTILTHALKIGTEPAFVPIELRAQELLAAPSIHHSDICELWSLFPVSKRLKPTQQTASHQSYIVLGLRPPAYPKPSHNLPAHYTIQRGPSLSLCQFFPRFLYTTISIATNINQGPHRDLNNADGLTLFTCLTQQYDGDLWIQNKSGKTAMQH